MWSLKVYLSAALVLYIYSVAVAKKEDTPASRHHIFLATSMALNFLAWSAWMHGGMADFPRILPMALIMSSLFFGYAFLGKGVFSYDRIMSNAGPMMVMILSLYAIIPRYESFARHLDIILLVTFGLPMIYAAPFFLGSKKLEIPAELYDEAYDASVLAYRKSPPPQGSEVEYVHNVGTGARCVIISSLNRIVIAFSGSDSKIDWIRTNLDGNVDKETGAHTGFLKAWRSIKDKVLTLAGDLLIRNGGGKNVTVLVTGHSQGGALAVIGAKDIREALDRPMTVVTFAAPPVGNDVFLREFDQMFTDSWRVFTVHDPVPKILVGTLDHPRTSRKVVIASPSSTAFASHGISHYERKDQWNTKALAIQSLMLMVIIAFFSYR